MSSNKINTENPTDTGLIAYPAAGPIKWAKTNIKLTKTVTIICPANIFANSRTINTNGFVITPVNSTIGISGKGYFNHQGTSGLYISFQ